LLAILIALVIALGVRPRSAFSGPVRLVLYGTSLLDGSFTGGVFPAFHDSWKAGSGKEVEFIGRFGSLGKILGEIDRGAPADLVVLSADWSVMESRGLALDHEGLPHGGVIGRTPIILVVRPGNPHGIQDFAGMARPGVKIIQPDTSTSGSAYWAVFAEFGAGFRRDGWQGGYELLRGIAPNLAGAPGSASEARLVFENGVGDVLVTTEQDALCAIQSGTLAGEIVYPRSTILSEPVLRIVTGRIDDAERPCVEAFTRFLWSETGQRILVGHGFRSVDPRLNEPVTRFGKIEDPFGIDDLGGWSAATRDIIHRAWKQARD
jgi:sulfate transport system substrate-binding protein